MTTHRKPARYHIDQYRLEHGAYHLTRWNKGQPEARKEHYWVYPDIKDASGIPLKQFYFGIEGQTPAYLAIRKRAQAILDQLATQAKDHPKPAHLSRAKSRFQKTMSLPELARRWEVDEETIRKRIRCNELPATRTSQRKDGKRGGNYRVAFEDILSFEESHGLVAPSPTPTKAQPKEAARPKASALGMPASEAAKRTGLSRASFYRLVHELISSNTIRPACAGKKGMRFSESDIEKILLSAPRSPRVGQAVSTP